MASSAPTEHPPGSVRAIGRPAIYSDAICERTTKLCLLGATDADLAVIYEVNEDTIQDWKNRHPAFSAALARGREDADADVAMGLHKRATGFARQTTRVSKRTDDNGEPITYDVEEYYPPDVAAASLWLRNRQGKRWRDKTDVVHSGTISLEAWVIEATPAPAPARVIEGDVKRLDDTANPDQQPPTHIE